MQGKYLVVDRTVLPGYFGKVVEAGRLIETGEVKDVSEAVKKVGISRSTYYKYKDRVMELSQKDVTKRAMISMMLSHTTGVLASIIDVISEHGFSIWTINQSPPVHDQASVMAALEMTPESSPVEELLDDLERLEGLRNVRIIGIE